MLMVFILYIIDLEILININRSKTYTMNSTKAILSPSHYWLEINVYDLSEYVTLEVLSNLLQNLYTQGYQHDSYDRIELGTFIALYPCISKIKLCLGNKA
jgi:hypothetical protein